jgi:iron complex outermembrane receptor protein
MFQGKTRWAGLCLIFWYSSLSAQDCHLALRGRITDTETNQPLAYATIFVQEAGKGGLSDEFGNYAIPNLCEGASYTVEVSHLECAHLIQVVRLQENHEVDFHLTHNAMLHEVTITEKAVAPPPVQSEVKVASIDLEIGKGLNLGETLKRLAGVSSLNTGATISKPVIQGLHSNRIAIVSDNVVIEGQQWGSEHAPEIDPFTADQISVVKGAAGVRYGTGAIAGAVILAPQPLREKSGVGGWLYLGGFSNGYGGHVSGQADWRLPNQNLVFRLQGTAKRSGNLRAPDYWLGNTGLQEFNASAAAAWKHGRSTHQINISRFDQQLAVMRSAHIGNLTDLQNAINSDVPLNNKDAFSYILDRPYQSVRHHTLKYEWAFRLTEKWKISAQYSFQDNYRQEFDVIRSNDPAKQKKPQVTFQLWTNSAQVALEHFPIHHWQGGIGVQAQQQTNYVGKGGYIPDFNTWSGAVWAMERYRRFPLPLEFEIGLRYDYRRNNISYAEGTFLPAGYARDTAVQFGNISGTTGVIYHFSQYLRLALNTAYTWRPPHVYELFARGIHFVSATYEEGNRQMIPEKAWNNQLSAYWESPKINVSLTIYRNDLRDFIYLQPTDELVLTVRNSFPKYVYRQNDAVLQGLDWSGSIHVLPQWALDTRVSILRASLKTAETTRKWLPLMPADRFQYGIKWSTQAKPKPASSEAQKVQHGNSFVRVMASTTLRQNRAPLEGLLKPTPAGFTLLSLDAGHTIFWDKRKTNHSGRQLELAMTIQNLGNTRYREYLNFFRFFADEPGINVGIRAKIIF